MRHLQLWSRNNWRSYPHRPPPVWLIKQSVALDAQAQLAATPAPPCPEFSTKNVPEEVRIAPTNKINYFHGMASIRGFSFFTFPFMYTR